MYESQCSSSAVSAGWWGQTADPALQAALQTLKDQGSSCTSLCPADVCLVAVAAGGAKKRLGADLDQILLRFGSCGSPQMV